ncbi:MAG TPA: XRE family transcriptional regulator [Lachnospiraceae bacterium]|jgi:putative transcriptional regulator|nr:XRE family transcriptional regulator [Lachnospiraceae bacterium]
MIRIKLSRVMGDRRITQAELCRKTGIGKHTINDLYQDFTDRVSLSQLDTICDALECTLDDLLEYTPNPKRPSESDRFHHKKR